LLQIKAFFGFQEQNFALFNGIWSRFSLQSFLQKRISTAIGAGNQVWQFFHLKRQFHLNFKINLANPEYQKVIFV
jgi:hypothetical protein